MHGGNNEYFVEARHADHDEHLAQHGEDPAQSNRERDDRQGGNSTLRTLPDFLRNFTKVEPAKEKLQNVRQNFSHLLGF
jgi:hypothetical protein